MCIKCRVNIHWLFTPTFLQAFMLSRNSSSIYYVPDTPLGVGTQCGAKSDIYPVLKKLTDVDRTGINERITDVIAKLHNKGEWKKSWLSWDLKED